MSSPITMSGVGSNLPIDDWISKLVKVKQTSIDSVTTDKNFTQGQTSALSTIKTSYSSLLTTLQKFTDASFGVSSDIFAKNSATVSDSSILTATVTNSAAKQNLSVFVSQLATSTTAQSTSATPIGAYVDRDTKITALANGAGKAGAFSVFVDGTKYSINVESADTVGSVLDKISSQTGLYSSISSDGKIQLGDSIDNPTSSTKNIVIGTSADTSNFATATALKKNAQGGYASNQSVFKVNTSALLTSVDAGFATQVKEGSFKIGSATFTIEANTTMQGLISQINSSADSGVNAYWDNAAGKMVLKAKQEGAYNINIENISGNFTDVVGLTSSTYDTNGKVLSSKLVNNSQDVGKIAILKINGTEIISPTNTVTSDISGLSGVTLALKGQSKDATTTTVGISADNTEVVSALDAFVAAFNTAISNTDQATASDGYLYGESTLTTLRNNIRQTATASINLSGTGMLKNLSEIGITTGAIGTGVKDNTNKLVLDKTKLQSALAADPEKVKKLLVGDGTNDGVLKKLSTSVSASLDPLNGFFVTKAKTYDTQIADYTKKIDTKTTELADYKTALTKKFSALDAMVAKLNDQLSRFKQTLGIS